MRLYLPTYLYKRILHFIHLFIYFCCNWKKQGFFSWSFLCFFVLLWWPRVRLQKPLAIVSFFVLSAAHWGQHELLLLWMQQFIAAAEDFVVPFVCRVVFIIIVLVNLQTRLVYSFAAYIVLPQCFSLSCNRTSSFSFFFSLSVVLIRIHPGWFRLILPVIKCSVGGWAVFKSQINVGHFRKVGEKCKKDAKAAML